MSQTILKQEIEIFDLAVTKLKEREKVVVKADDKFIEQEQRHSSTFFRSISLSRSEKQREQPRERERQRDLSYVLEDQGRELVTCQNCLEEIDSRKLRKHLKESCSGREVSCPNPACSEKVPLLALSWHLQAECVVERSKRQKAENALIHHKASLKSAMLPPSSSTATLNQSNTIKSSSSILHSSSTPSVLNLSENQSNFEYNEMNMTSEVPNSLCNLCGEAISWRELNNHKEKLCRFRLVCCPHAFVPNGCPVTEMPWATLTTHLAYNCIIEKRKIDLIRNSILRNNPILCRMCGEMVNFSTIPLHEEKLCKNRLVQCRNHALGCPALLPNQEKETHESGKGLYPRYILAMNGYGGFLDLMESDLKAPWTAEFWIYRSLPIASLVSSLRTIFSQLLSYEISYLAEINIQKKVSDKIHFLEKLKKKNTDELSKEEKIYKQKKNNELAAQAIQEIKQHLLPSYSEILAEYIKNFQYLAVSLEAALVSIDEIDINRPCTKATLDTKISLKTTYLGEEIDLELEKELDKLRKAKEDLLVSGGEVLGDDNVEMNVKPQTPGVKTRVNIPKEIDLEPSVIFNNEDLPDDSTSGPQFIRNLSSLGKLLVIGKGSISHLLRQAWSQTHPNSKSKYFPRDTKTRSDIDKFINVEEHYSLTPDIALFLSLFLANPYNFFGHFEANNTETGAAILEMYESIYSLPIRQIRRLLLLFSRILKSDFDYLQELRVQSGMIVPDPHSSNTKSKNDTSMREQSRIERERKKRINTNGLKEVKIKDNITEIIKQGCCTEILMDSGVGKKLPSSICLALFSGLNILMPPTEGENISPFWPQFHEKENNETKKNEPSADLDKEKIKEHGKEDSKKGLGGHHYDLIINFKDFWSLRLLKGQPGIIYTETELDNNKLKEKKRKEKKIKVKVKENQEKDLESGKSIENDAENDDKENIKIEEIVKSDEENEGFKKLSFTRIMPFNTRIGRGKWHHFGLVATEEPNERVSFYLNGIFFQSIKNFSFPLPMGTFGGSSRSSLSFSGALCDTRFWSRALSSKEISLKHRNLLSLSLNQGKETFCQTIKNPKQSLKNTKNHKLENENENLIGWWTYEDGPPASLTVAEETTNELLTIDRKVPYKINRISDVTYKRFKTCFSNKLAYNFPLSIMEASNQLQNISNNNLKKNDQKEEVDDILAVLNLNFIHYVQLSPLFPVDFINITKNMMTKSDIHFVDIIQYEKSLFHGDSFLSTEFVTWLFNTINFIYKLHSSSSQSKWVPGEFLPVYFTASENEKNKKKSKNNDPKLNVSNVVTDESQDLAKRLREATKLARKSNLPYYLYLDNDIPNSSLLEGTLSPEGKPLTIPLPSYKQSQICPFELRRQRLAKKGRLLQKKNDCPLGCGELITSFMKKNHLKYQCVRRLIHCPQPCCSSMYPLNERDKHEKEDCVWAKRRNEMAIEGERREEIISCPLCSNQMKVKHYFNHKSNECIFRLILCPHHDCSLGSGNPSLEAHKLRHHFEYECDSQVIKRNHMYIDRARERDPYPRDWGIELEASS